MKNNAITELLREKYGFTRYRGERLYGNRNEFDLMRRIHDIHYLFWTERLNHFTIAVLQERPRKNPPVWATRGTGKNKGKDRTHFRKWKTIVLPRPVYSTEDCEMILKPYF